VDILSTQASVYGQLNGSAADGSLTPADVAAFVATCLADGTAAVGRRHVVEALDGAAPAVRPHLVLARARLDAEIGALDAAIDAAAAVAGGSVVPCDSATVAAAAVAEAGYLRTAGHYTRADEGLRRLGLLAGLPVGLRIDALLEEAALLAARGARREGGERLRAALEVARTDGDGGRRVIIQCRLAEWAARRGDVVRTAAYLGAAVTILRDENLDELRFEVAVARGVAWRACFEVTKAEEALLEALALARQSGRRADIGSALLELGTLLYRQGLLERADDLFDEAVTIETELGRRVALAETDFRRGNVARARGRLGPALDRYRRAEQLFEAAGHREGASRCLLARAGLAHTEGRSDEALRLLTECLAMRREAGDCLGAAQVYGEEAVIHRDRGETTRALELFTESLEIRREAGDRYGVAVVLNDMAMVHRFGGDYGQAMELYQQSLDTKRTMGDRFGQALTLNDMALALKDQGVFNEAFEAVEQGAALAEAIHARILVIRLRTNRAHLLAAFGDGDGALELLQTNVLEIERSGCLAELPKALGALAEIMRGRGCTDEAVAAVERVEAMATASGDRRGLAFALLQRAQLEADRAEFEAALDKIQHCRRLRTAMHDVRGLAEVSWREAVMLRALDDPASADVFERTAATARSAGFPRPLLIARIGLLDVACRAEASVTLDHLFAAEELLDEADDLEFGEGLFWAFRLLGLLHHRRGEGAPALRYLGRALETLDGGAWGGGRGPAEASILSTCADILAEQRRALDRLDSSDSAVTSTRGEDAGTLLCVHLVGVDAPSPRQHLLALVEVDRVIVPRLLRRRGEVVRQLGATFFAWFADADDARRVTEELRAQVPALQALAVGGVRCGFVDGVPRTDEHLAGAYRAAVSARVLSPES